MCHTCRRIIMCLYHIPLAQPLEAQDTRKCKISPLPLTLTMSQVEEQINRKLKEKKSRIMRTLRDYESHPFTLMSIIIPRDMKA